MLMLEHTHLFWGGECLKTGTVRNALRLRHGSCWNAKLAAYVRFNIHTLANLLMASALYANSLTQEPTHWELAHIDL